MDNKNRINRPKIFRNYNCWIEKNIFRFGNLANQRLVPEFINSIRRLHYKFGHKNIVLDFNEVNKIYPYPTTAIAGYIHYFKSQGISFDAINIPEYLTRINFLEPKEPEAGCVSQFHNCLDSIWIFKDSNQVNLLVNGVLANIRSKIQCEPGVLDACTWGLNEIMDNVIQHSESECGFIMTTIHKSSKDINVCVFDYGIGIYQSLKNSKSGYNPRSATDAISLAIQEGVTRDKKVGQGNGMWGLYNMVTLNSGHLGIISGKGGLNLNKGVVKTYSEIIMLNRKQQATTVNFHLKVNKDISIKEAIRGHELVDLYIENMADDFDNIIFKISEHASGTGTRQSGLGLRTEVINLYKKVNKPIILDFSDIGIISSSFADELIGKLIVELGFVQYQTIFKLVNMNPTIQSIVQHSLSQRMAESLKDNDKS